MNSVLKHAGNCNNLLTYQIGIVIYDLTIEFINRYIGSKDRTYDQMKQAARSGKQNIEEGNEAATTSKETQIKLTNVAKASFRELLRDYEDYLRNNNRPIWDNNHPRFIKLRNYARSREIHTNYHLLLPKLNDEELANLAITLLHIEDYLLMKQIDGQIARFLKEGGVRETLTHARLQERAKGARRN